MSALPDPKDISELFTILLGKQVTVKSGAPAANPNGGTLAVYSDDDGAVGAVALSDLPLASNAGAALSMIPAGMAEESIKAGTLAENLADNWHEVLNVASQLFNAGNGHRVKLADIHPAAEPPSAAAGLLGAPGARLDLEVAIVGYGSGTLSLVVA